MENEAYNYLEETKSSLGPLNTQRQYLVKGTAKGITVRFTIGASVVEENQGNHYR